MSLVPRGSDRTSVYGQGWTTAVQLANAIAEGHALPTQATTLVLGQGEAYHCGVAANLAAYYGLDGNDPGNSYFVAGRTWKGMAATGAASMAWNARNRRKAERESQTQWRALGEVPLHVTNHRLVIGIDGQLESFWLNGSIAAFDAQFDQYSMLIQPNGGSPMMFEGPAVPYVAVILHILLRGEVPTLSTGA